MTYTLHNGDCLDVLPTLAPQSIDAIIADPPYGTTACKWDSVIPLDAMWRELKRVIKPNGAIVLFGAQPFTSALVMSNANWFRYELVWNKDYGTGFLDAKRKPLRAHENILMFSSGQTTYVPQMRNGKPRKLKESTKLAEGYSRYDRLPYHNKTGERYPVSVLNFSNARQWGKTHPTQKPVDLMRYLVRTYTNVGETVLDFTMGSGTTGEACIVEGRDFIGIEKEPKYYDIATNRLANVQPSLLEALNA